MKNTENYFNCIDSFRASLREINARYAPEYERLSQFRGSDRYPEEIRQAANTCAGCPVALRSLQELARRNGHSLALDRELSGDAVSQALRALRNNGARLIGKLEAPGSRREYVNSGTYDMFRLDCDPADPGDCLRVFGAVTDAAAFSAAVDGEQG